MMTRSTAVVWTALMATAVVGWATESSAATITLPETGISRKVALRDASMNPLWISKADCVADDVMTFPLQIADYAGLQLEVWAGTEDCTSMAARSGTTATCWRVSDPISPTGTTANIEVRVRDIVGRHLPPQTGPGKGTEADCTPAAGAAPVPVSLYFMFVNPGSQENAGGYQWKTSFDLVGPDAPTEFMAEASGAEAKLTWQSTTSTDAVGYGLFRESSQGSDCTQSTFKEGAPAPSTVPFSQVKGIATNATSIPLPATGADSIALVAMDSVGNYSVQANPVCLKPAAAAPEAPAAAEDDGGCSVSPNTPASGGWILGLLGAAFATLVLRRNRF